MPVIFNKIIELITHKTELQPNPFKKDSIEEIIIYSTSEFDKITPEIIEIAKENRTLKVDVKRCLMNMYFAKWLIFLN